MVRLTAWTAAWRGSERLRTRFVVMTGRRFAASMMDWRESETGQREVNIWHPRRR